MKVKVTKVTSLHFGSLSNRGKSAVAAEAQSRYATRKVVIGGGVVTSLHVTAHIQKQMAPLYAPASGGQARKVLIGGGVITAPGVAAHLRKRQAL